MLYVNKEGFMSSVEPLAPKPSGYFILDDNLVENSEMVRNYLENYPLVDFEHDGEVITKIVILNKPEKPIPNDNQEVHLTQNKQGEWEYVLVDKHLTEIQLLQQELAEQKALINAILGVTE